MKIGCCGKKTKKGDVVVSTVTLQCARPDLGTEYALFIYKTDRVEVMYLKVVSMQGRVWLAYDNNECIKFEDYPEAKQLHNGLGWNLEELAAWSRLVSEDREFLAAVKA